VGSFKSSKRKLGSIVGLNSATSARPRLNITNTNADAASGALRFIKNGSSPADDDVVGTISFLSENDTAEEKEYGQIKTIIGDASNETENGSLIISSFAYGDNGGLTEVARTNPMVGTQATIGFGHRRAAYNVSSGTALTLLPEHSGMIVNLRNAFSSNFTITLPDDTGLYTGLFYTIFISVDITGDLAIQTAASGDMFLGAIRATSTTANKTDIFPVVLGDAKDKLLFDADTKGRLAGSVYHLTLMGTDKWLVEGHALTTGNTPANPWTTI
jgi:hypothetical protein